MTNKQERQVTTEDRARGVARQLRAQPFLLRLTPGQAKGTIVLNQPVKKR